MIRQIIHDFLTLTFFANISSICLYIIYRLKKLEVDTDNMFIVFLKYELFVLACVVTLNGLSFFLGKRIKELDDYLFIFCLTNVDTLSIIIDALKDLKEEDINEE